MIPYLSHIDDRAKAIGAVNTIVNRNGQLFGYNTDYNGLVYTVEKNHIPIREKKVLVLGNGGASMAVSAMLYAQSVREVSSLLSG